MMEKGDAWIWVMVFLLYLDLYTAAVILCLTVFSLIVTLVQPHTHLLCRHTPYTYCMRSTSHIYDDASITMGLQPNSPTMADPAPTTIPLYYRLPMLYIEPICALNGAYLLLSSPSHFLTAVSPHFPVPPPTSTLESFRIITDMLGIMHLVFAFNLAVVLRVVGGQVDVWRTMCAGMLLSDVLHIVVSVREYGVEGSLAVWGWRVNDWLNFGLLWGMGLVRVGIVLGWGLPKGKRRVS